MAARVALNMAGSQAASGFSTALWGRAGAGGGRRGVEGRKSRVASRSTGRPRLARLSRANCSGVSSGGRWGAAAWACPLVALLGPLAKGGGWVKAGGRGGKPAGGEEAEGGGGGGPPLVTGPGSGGMGGPGGRKPAE